MARLKDEPASAPEDTVPPAPAPNAPAAAPEKKTPAAWAAQLGHTKPADARLPEMQRIPFVLPAYAVADKLYGWSERAYHFQDPKDAFEVTLATYSAALATAVQFPATELTEAALTQLKQDFVAGFVLSPVETRICPSPFLTLENTAALPPGTKLELFVLGLAVAEHLAPYGQWQSVGEGQVSDDGATLEFPDGLPMLTAVAVRVLD